MQQQARYPYAPYYPAQPYQQQPQQPQQYQQQQQQQQQQPQQFGLGAQISYINGAPNGASAVPRAATAVPANYASYPSAYGAPAGAQYYYSQPAQTTTTTTISKPTTTIINGSSSSSSSSSSASSSSASRNYNTLTPATKKPAVTLLSKKSKFRILIDGKAEECAQSYEVINPSTGKAFDICPSPTPQDLERAIAAGLRAFKTWSQTPLDERKRVLVAAADVIDAHADELAELLAKEQGKSLANAKAEIGHSAIWLRTTASFELKTEPLTSIDGGNVSLHRRPLGLTAGIVPWNFPVTLAVWKISASTFVGNTIIIKPSPFTPLATLRLGELIKDVFPPGVVQILSGDDSFGAIITKHPAFAKVSFTGSAATGRKVMATAADTLKRVTLELGGNDAAIVLKDADVKAVAPKIFAGAFANSGQVCAAIKRVYVHESLFQPLVDELADCARKSRFGDAFEADVEYGPLNNKMQYDRILELLADAKAHGAKVVTGGGPIKGRQGYFIEPTILTNVHEGERIVDEEQFGPVLPVMPFKEEDEAVARANNTLFGLCGSVWSNDTKHATEVAARLESGTAWVNQHLGISPFVPFGGAKCSGVGFENGERGLDNWCQFQVLNVAPVAQDAAK